jgi:TolB-like protein
VPDVFLSYNREDLAEAKAYADALTAAGLEVWWDVTLHSGEAYDEVTETALREAKTVIVLWSPRSVASRWVRAEATVAERNKTLMPVTIEPCDRPVMFELTQTVDLSHWHGEVDDKGWLAFLDDVKRMVGRHTPEPAPVPDAHLVATSNGISTVAVIPFTSRVGDTALEILAEDFTDDLTRELGRNRFFEVIAARTMAAWRGKQVHYRTIGQELGARYLIEGKLQRVEDALRLTVQVIGADSTKMLWSHRFERQKHEMDAAPDEFPAFVAADLGERIAQIEGNRAANKSGPYSAWEHLLRAIALSQRMGTDSSHRAIEEARSAIAAAPDLGFAHAFLAAEIGTQEWTEGKQLDEADRKEIQEHIRLAIQFEGDDPTVISWLTGAYYDLSDGETCLRLALRAVEREPDLPRSHHMLGQAYMHLGRAADAIVAYREMERRVAFHNYRYLGLAMLGACCLIEGRLEEAEAALDKSLALHPDFIIALKWKAIASAQVGNEQTAQTAVRRLKEVAPTMTIDQHVWQINRNPKFAERSTEHIASLRRLWEEVDGA